MPLRCRGCKSDQIQLLPPNKITRNPGYICRRCSLHMRPPGSGCRSIFVIALCCCFFAVGVALIIALLAYDKKGIGLALGIGSFLCGIPTTVVMFVIRQLRRPTPLKAPE
jgi:hypothetical protein